MLEIGVQLDDALSIWDKPDSPGFVLGLIQDGELIYKRGFGMANLEHDVPITPDTVFRIGSMSKQFTGMCIALLEERGEISLDDNIQKYIPEFPTYSNPITLRHLVHHTSGIRNYNSLFGIQGSLGEEAWEKRTEADALEIICSQKSLNFEPGEQFQYSNSGYFLLGLIVKRVSGLTLREFAKTNIFDPLEMNSTHYHDDHKMIVKNRAYGHAPREDGKFELFMGKTEIIGDGCVFSTVEDLAKWDANFYSNKLDGGMDLMGRYLTPGTLNNGESTEYAYGLMISEEQGQQLIWHNGQYAGYGGVIVQYPEEKFTVMILYNVIGGSYIPRNLVIRTVNRFRFPEKNPQESDEKKEITDEEPSYIDLPEVDLEKFVGTYLHPGGFYFNITREGSNIFMDSLGSNLSRTSYAPVSPTRIKSKDGPLNFIVDIKKSDEKQSLELSLTIPNQEPIQCESVGLTISEDEIKEFEGAFFNEDVRATYKLYRDSDTLVCEFPTTPPTHFPMFCLGRDVFMFCPLPDDYVQFKFIRNERKEISGFWFVAPDYVSDFKFEKQI